MCRFFWQHILTSVPASSIAVVKTTSFSAEDKWYEKGGEFCRNKTKANISRLFFRINHAKIAAKQTIIQN